MALVVEDGTGVASANGFVSVNEADAYFANRGDAVWAARAEADKEAAIVRASEWLSSYWRWKGAPVKDRDGQGLAWPRTGVTDCEGRDVASDVVPIEVKRATYAAAAFEATSPGALSPTVTPGQQVKRETIGPLEFEYREPRERGRGSVDGVDDSRPVVTQVQDQIRCLVTGIYPVPYPVTA